MPPLFTLHNMHLQYRGASAPALNDITLSINAGEMIGLLGPNGSGKTTLLHVLSGILAPTRGSALLKGTPIASMPQKERAKRIGSVPQRMPDPPHLSAETMVLMGRYPYTTFFSGYTKEDYAIARAAMQATATDHLAYRQAGELSGGEFQRVLIARALAQQPGSLLLDEATSGLDIARKMEIFDMLASHNANGTTVIAAIHDLNLAAQYCQRLIFLKEGNIVLDGAVETVFTSHALSSIYETPVSTFVEPRTRLPQAVFIPPRLCSLCSQGTTTEHGAPEQMAPLPPHRHSVQQDEKSSAPLVKEPS